MKAQELRIGNWVKDVDDHSEFYQVREIFEDGFSAGPMTVYPAGMEFNYGIELTDEWILKFWFEGRDDFKWKKGSLIGIQIIDGSFYLALKDLGNVLYHSIVKIKYVHQLQNVFLDLSGQELTMTP